MPTADPDRYGPDPAEWRPQYDEWAAKYLRPSVAGTPVVGISTPALPEPLWIKQAFLEAQANPIRQEFGTYDPADYRPLGHVSQPGDIMWWEYVPDNPYGHVEIVPDRSWRTRLREFLARLADSVRGRK